MKHFGKMMLRTGLAAMAMGMAGNAWAAVTYSFKALSSYDTPFGEFVFTVPDFLSGVNLISAASLTSCSVTSPSTGYTCGDQELDTTFYDVAPFYATVGFGTQTSVTYYYFNAGSFATIGTHDSQIFGQAQFAQLTVSGFGIGAVPEPATWGMMLLGFGIIGGAMRRGRVVRPRLA
jgi:PEP-CTERM motif